MNTAMNTALGRYLVALKNQVATTLRPNDLGEFAEKYSLYTERVLNYLAVESRDLPTLRHDALSTLCALMQDLAAALCDDPALVQALHSQITGDGDFASGTAALQNAIAKLQQQNDPASAMLLQRIGSIELDLQQSFLDAIAKESAPVVAQADANEGLSETQKQKLTMLLRKRFPQDGALTIGKVKAIPGGFSKQTIFLDLLDTTILPAKAVLRIDKPDGPVETTVVDEYQFIEAMYAAGVPVPKPLLLEADKSVLGNAFVLVARVDGTSAGDAFDVIDPVPGFALTLAQGMAKMHAVPLAAVSDQVRGAQMTVQQRMLDDIDNYEKKWRATQKPSVTLEIAYGWLRANIAMASAGTRCIVHRDVGCHNLLVKDGRLAAILDWETALIGDPAQDVAYVWHTVTQALPWEDFLDEYARNGGTRPAPGQIYFYRVWRMVWLMTMQIQARAAIEAGYSNDIGLIYNVLNLFQRLTVSLQALLCEIGEQN